MSPPRRRKNSVSYLDGDNTSDEEPSHGKSTRPRGYGRPGKGLQREDSLIKTDREDDEIEDSQWDTDYDPKDKYYLSSEDDTFHLYPPERDKTSKYRPGRDRERSPKTHGDQHDSSSRRKHSPSRSHRHSPHRHSHLRDDDHETTDRHQKPDSSHPKPSTSSSARRPRPRASRASSSYTAARTRPRPARGLTHNSTRRANPKATKPKPWEDFPWEEAAKVALQAGTVTAIKVGTEPAPWSVKGTKIASAAIGAAVVDHVLKPKKKGGIKYTALRHFTEVAMGNLVVGPAIGQASGARGSGASGGGKGGGKGEGGGGRRR